MTAKTPIRPKSGDELFELLMLGMVAMRQDLGRSEIPKQHEMAAVWAWGNRALADDGFEHDMLENVMDGHMWADWQNGGVVFRLTPAGIAHVEGMVADRGLDSVEDLMRQQGMDPDKIKVHLSDGAGNA